MDKYNQNDSIQDVLSTIHSLLKNVGSTTTIVTDEVTEFLEEKVEGQNDKEILHTLLDQIQEVNVQMENMSWLNKHYRILHEFAQVCSKTLDENTLLNKAYEMVSQVMPTDSFFIALYNEGEEYINLVFFVENGKFFENTFIEFGNNFTSKVIETKEIIHQKKAGPLNEYHQIIGDFETSSCLFVPVIIDDHVKGVISAQSISDFAYRKEHGELLQIIGNQVINSIETARLYEKIYMMSRTDELTGLKNHRAFHEDLGAYIQEGKEDISLIMIDSDNLKKINDQFGHDAGDLYLKLLADGIKNICNDHFEGYRYAGDEFMIILKSKTCIEDINEKLRSYYSNNPLTILNNQIYVSISSGVAFYPIHGSTVDSLKKSADNALYVAKENGRNRMVIAEFA